MDAYEYDDSEYTDYEDEIEEESFYDDYDSETDEDY